MTTQFLTGIFKLHNPSNHKRMVIDFAMREYTLGYAQLLDWAENNLTILTSDGKYREKYNGKAIASLLPRLGMPIHSSLKDSLITDVAGNLASYLALKETVDNVSFPVCRDPSPMANIGALEDMSLVGSDIEDFAQCQARMLAIARGSVMPLYFSRADGASQMAHGNARNRNFSILANTKKDQLLAVLYLLPNGHELGKSIDVNGSNLVRIDTGEIFKSNSRCAILVPLQTGRNGWQEHKFLSPSRLGQASIKSAFLARNDESGEYFLHVSFSFPCPEDYKPTAYLGIDKGILFTAAYALIDSDGRVIKVDHIADELRSLQIKHGRERERTARSGKKVTKRHYKRQAYDNILHGLANELIELAIEHQAQIVVEDLNIQVRGGRVVSRFRKLDRILSYKCKLAGVPFRSVFAAYSSQICHRCGEDMQRFDRLVVCETCEYRGHSDDNAAINIARRALYRKKQWEKNGGYRAFHRSFRKWSDI